MEFLQEAWQQLTREFEAAQTRACEACRARLTDELNQLTRRLRHYSVEADWFDAVLDGAAAFAPQVAIFAVSEDDLILKGTRNLELTPALRIPLREASAFQSTIVSEEPAVVLCTKSEVSEPVASAISIDRGFIAPMVKESRTVALLFATVDQRADTNALELIAQVAPAVLKRSPQGISQVQITPLPTFAPAKALTADREHLMNATGPDGLMHVRARRMARAKVAEMQLYRPEACKSGRAQSDVYLFLKQEVDAARAAFRKQFLSTTSMTDYLHFELLRQLAGNEEKNLGADYPGQMV